MKSPPLSLYVHVPWCERKCPYCDFNSYEARTSIPEDAYVSALLRDLDAEKAFAEGRPLISVFIGGGTPSLFSGAAIERLLEGIRARVAIEPGSEITLEANPGTVEVERFAAFRRAGVNRLSIGVQSFRDHQLKSLGRIHGAKEALQAVERAKGAGFEALNLDLMYGLPGDSVRGAMADLATALLLEPMHLSWYQLTLEPSTRFHRRPPAGLPEDEEILEIERRGGALLESAGFRRYEVSAHAREGCRSTHNLHYWRFGDYLGIGAGAHGKVTLVHEGAVLRRAKRRNPLSYMQHAGTLAAATSERIEPGPQLATEFMMNALRLVEGFEVTTFRERTGLPLAALERPLEEARQRGWLWREGNRVRPTTVGLQFLNAVLALFLDDSAGGNRRVSSEPATGAA